MLFDYTIPLKDFNIITTCWFVLINHFCHFVPYYPHSRAKMYYIYVLFHKLCSYQYVCSYQLFWQYFLFYFFTYLIPLYIMHIAYRFYLFFLFCFVIFDGLTFSWCNNFPVVGTINFILSYLNHRGSQQSVTTEEARRNCKEIQMTYFKVKMRVM